MYGSQNRKFLERGVSIELYVSYYYRVSVASQVVSLYESGVRYLMCVQSELVQSFKNHFC